MDNLFQQQSRLKTGTENTREQRFKCWWFLPLHLRCASAVHIHYCTRARAKTTQLCASGTSLPHRSHRNQATRLCPPISANMNSKRSLNRCLGGRKDLPSSQFLAQLQMICFKLFIVPHAGRVTVLVSPAMT